MAGPFISTFDTISLRQRRRDRTRKRRSDRIYNTRRDESVKVHAFGRKTILRLNLSRWLDAHRRRRRRFNVERGNAFPALHTVKNARAPGTGLGDSY